MAESDDWKKRLFQLTLPMRGAICRLCAVCGRTVYFNSRSPCGERFTVGTTTTGAPDFNSRSPCGERFNPSKLMPIVDCISTHAPHAGSDHRPDIHQPAPPIFQLTLPMRGAIGCHTHFGTKNVISTHAPHAGSDNLPKTCDPWFLISTHAPHAGSDAALVWVAETRCCHFNSRLPSAWSDTRFPHEHG